MQDLRSRAGTVLKATASGMLPTAIFTPFYAIWSVFAWPVPGTIAFVLALVWSIYLAVTGRRFSRLSAELPDERDAHDERIMRGMTIVSSAQGGLVLLAVVVLGLLGQFVWTLPVVALIAALHFFPMPALLGRTVDYYLGTGMAIAALTGLTLAGMGATLQLVWAVTGLGGALVTSLHGLYLVRAARRTLAQFTELTASD